ncbi:hypothetical protein HPB50_014148 [Hyalomma asiaticum]|uniref:Uncharacterized protein n=1 Tax=Hyalomma asiaticum TaxID=266040 RepID=A0ACB7TGC4_HYAAI|nr:hypothetical protein HPB50_014148 [Hyalomma asiaticum]
MPGVPKTAYVQYHDGYRAIVSVKQIKDFDPVVVTDCPKNKEVYWRSDLDGVAEESYFPADIVLLGTSFSDLIQRMNKKRIPVPDNIFCDADPEGVSTPKPHVMPLPLPSPPPPLPPLNQALPPPEEPKPGPPIPPASHPEIPTDGLQEAASQVHLGSGVYVGEQQWAWLLSRPKDSLFCKETTKALWGVAQLRNRSLTGAPCRRFARQENQGPPRRALTPLKLGAVAKSTKKLESSGAALTQSVELMLDVQERFATVPDGPVADRVTAKLKAVLDKNPGFYVLKQVSNVLSGTNSKIPGEIRGSKVPDYKYAPLTSVDVERSFSAYKQILTERRHNFKPEKLEMVLVCHCFHSLSHSVQSP